MIPAAFVAPKVLRRLNIAAVGLALASATAAIFGVGAYEFSGLLTGVPTLAFGLMWAFLLRVPSTVGKSKVRWGWLASIPLAAMNSGLAAALWFSTSGHGNPFGSFLEGMVAGATFGMIFWVPALLLTLVAFGLPIAWAQKLAKKGLAGEERGEWVIGLVSALVASGALVLSFAQAKPPEWLETLPNEHQPMVVAGVVFMRGAAVLAVLAGTAAVVLATARENRRRAFVANAERGAVPGFRVDATPEGKALVRVSSLGHGYRVSDFVEELVRLDKDGHAVESRTSSGL